MAVPGAQGPPPTGAKEEINMAEFDWVALTKEIRWHFCFYPDDYVNRHIYAWRLDLYEWASIFLHKKNTFVMLVIHVVGLL